MVKRKLFLIFLGYILGIIMELYFEKGIALFVVLIVTTTLISKYTKFSRNWFIKKKQFWVVKRLQKYLKIFLNIKIICIFMFSFIVGVIYTKYLNFRYDNLYIGIQDGNFIGIIQSNPEEREYVTRYKIKILSVNGYKKYKNTNLYLNVSNDLEKLKYGDLISFKGEYIEPETQKNYGGFNYKEYLRTLKIYGTVKCTENNVKLQGENNVNIINLKMNDLSNRIKENVYKIFKEKEANLLIGILIGDITKIDEDLEKNFRNSSLLHVLAVSGTHVNYIVLGLVYINNKLRINKKIGRIITIIILILFMFLVGFSPSVVRAVIMGITIIVAQLFYRNLDVITSISFSALILLLINPFSIINAGFLLSYGGTIGIVGLSKNINKIIMNKNKDNYLISNKKIYVDKLLSYVKDVLVITISAQIIIIPILWRMFNTISFTFFISNLLASPIMGFITIFGFIAVFISFISITIAKVLAMPLDFMIKFLIFIASFFGSMKISKINVITIPMIFIMIYYIGIYIVNYYIYLKNKKLDRKEKRILLMYEKLKKNYKKILISFTLFFIIYNLFSNITREFKIHFIDVGQR